MTDDHTQNLAKKCLEQLEELVLLNKLLPTQLSDIRTHLDPIARPAPPIIPRKPSTTQQSQALPQCKAIWSYTATDTDELTFKENDRIEIVQEVDAAWWKGCVIDGERQSQKPGLFPSNYVEKIRLRSSSSSTSVPKRNLPPVYTPSINSDQSSNTYNDHNDYQRMQGNHPSMPSPYGMEQGPPKWQSNPIANWSGPVSSPSTYSQNSYMTAPQSNPPPPANHYISPQPSGTYISPVVPPEKQGLSQTPTNNQSYYNSEMHQAPQDPSNPAIYGTQQPVVEDKNKHDKLKKMGGRLGGTMINSFAGGVGFGLGSHLF